MLLYRIFLLNTNVDPFKKTMCIHIVEFLAIYIKFSPHSPEPHDVCIYIYRSCVTLMIVGRSEGEASEKQGKPAAH